jgi:hypothetical protein
MTVLTEETVTMSGSGFTDGVEFEETFPQALADVSEDHDLAAGVSRPATAAVDAAILGQFHDQLEQRLREAESMVKQTVERMRLDEEQRLVEWVQERRAEEERRLAKWAEDRRAAIERSIQERITRRNAEEARLAQSRRASDETRLAKWRADLEDALKVRTARPQSIPPAALSDEDAELRASLRDAVAATTSARDVGRALRDAVAEVTPTVAFALAVHQRDRDEVVYRYRVASDDELGNVLRRDSLDDGPGSAVASTSAWSRSQSGVRTSSRSVTVHTAQHAVRDGDRTIGVVTLQTEDEPIASSVLERVDDLVRLCAPQLSGHRDNGSFRSV